MAEWQKAGSLEELNPLFKSMPPPLTIKHTVIPLIPKEQEYIATPYNYEQATGANTPQRRNIFVYIIIGVALLIGISAFTSYRMMKLNALKLKCKMQNRHGLCAKTGIREIKADLIISYQNLENAKRNLDDVSAFKLLRSAGKRHEQITEANNSVSSRQNKVNALETELNELSGQ